MHRIVVETRRLVSDSGILAQPDPEIHEKAVAAAEAGEVEYIEAYAMLAFGSLGRDVAAYKTAEGGVRICTYDYGRERHFADCAGVGAINHEVLKMGIADGVLVRH